MARHQSVKGPGEILWQRLSPTRAPFVRDLLDHKSKSKDLASFAL